MALTVERTQRIDAHTVLTHHSLTLVHVDNTSSYGILDGSRSLTAVFYVFVGSIDGTRLARISPSPSDRAATNVLRDIGHHLARTDTLLVLDVAGGSTHVDASSSWNCHETFWTITKVSSVGVGTGSGTAETRTSIAFVFVDAIPLRFVERKTCRTGTHEAPERVGAFSTPGADGTMRILVTFIDVFQRHAEDVGSEPGSAWTKLLVF